MNFETSYIDLLKDILYVNGIPHNDRTGVGTVSVFGRQLIHDFRNGFPLLTHKKVGFGSVAAELLWFLEGSTDERRLAELTYGKPREEVIGKKTIWTANADAQGVALGYRNDDLMKYLGPVYGKQWRDFNGVDQIDQIISDLLHNKESRRIILTAWHPEQLSKMALPPCHVMYIFSVKEDKLSCMLIQRSVDLVLGAPFNVASTALLMHILARETGLQLGKLVYTMADAHIYNTHIEGVKGMLNKKLYPFPTLDICDDFRLDLVLKGETPLDWRKYFSLNDYKHGSIEVFDMAV